MSALTCLLSLSKKKETDGRESDTMAKEINRVSFEIEHYDGDSYMTFMLSIKEDGTVEVINEKECSLADIDGDYIYGTDNDLYRIQADEPISEDKFEEIWDCYNEHEGDDC
jgi:hypothetical protein